MTLVLDASVALKWYVPEEHAELAQSILRSGEQLIAPQLILAEVANASWKLVRRGELDPQQHHRIAAAVARPFDLLAPLSALLPRAAALALELDHPIRLLLSGAERGAHSTAGHRRPPAPRQAPADGLQRPGSARLATGLRERRCPTYARSPPACCSRKGRSRCPTARWCWSRSRGAR